MPLFRPRFSLRTLVIVVILICLYLGAWEATKRYAVPLYGTPVNQVQYFGDASSPAPCIVAMKHKNPRIRHDGNLMILDCKTCYYVWLLGPTIKLPFESASPAQQAFLQ